MIKGIVFGVLLTIVGLAILVLNLMYGSWGGGYFGLILILFVAVPIGLILVHKFAKQMPAYIYLAYNLVGSIVAWAIIMITTSYPPEVITSLGSNSHPFLFMAKLLPTLWVFASIALIVGIFFPSIRAKFFKNAAKEKWWVVLPIPITVIALLYSIAFMWELDEPLGTLWDVMLWVGYAFALPMIGASFISSTAQSLLDWGEKKGFREFAYGGRGGSARWAGPETLNKFKVFVSDKKFRPPPSGGFGGAIFLGETLPQDTITPHYVGVDDDAHMVTIGMTGAGKSTACLFNNLPLYQGDILVIDPKGELADYSAPQRCGNLHNTIYVLDPFGSSKLPEHFKAGYNPLADINIHEEGAMRFIQGITDACVIHEGEKNIHFSETARNFIEGLIAHVLSTKPKHQHNLPYVYDMLLGIGDINKAKNSNMIENFEKLLDDMSVNMACGALPVQGAKQIRDSGNEAYGSLLSTTQRSLKWVSDPQMRKQLNPDHNLRELSLRQLGAGNQISVYIVLPFDYLPVEKQGRWMRLLINFGLSCVQIQPEPPSPKVLFVVDEFYSLGYFKRIEDGVVQLRAAGVKLWLFIQNLGQLKKLYKENWESFTGSANTQVLAIQDSVTAEWVSGQIGSSRHGAPLVNKSEVLTRLDKATRRQIIIPVEGFPMQLKSVFYKDLVPEKFRGMKAEDEYGHWGDSEELRQLRRRREDAGIRGNNSLFDNETLDKLNILKEHSIEHYEQAYHHIEKRWLEWDNWETPLDQRRSLIDGIINGFTPALSSYATEPNETQNAHPDERTPVLSDEIEHLIEEWGYEGENVPESLEELGNRYADRKKLFPTSMHRVLDEQYALLKSVFFN